MRTILCIFCLLFGVNLQAAEAWKASSEERQLNEKRAMRSTSSLHSSEKDSLPAKQLSKRPQTTDSGDFWIYDAWIELNKDTDRDGFYSGFTLFIDVDSHFAQAPVYARLYLGKNDSFREYHSTSDFFVNGQSSNDFFEVSTELLEGFADNDYEILIELYDADRNELVAVYDSFDDEDLLYLPLESRDYEYNQVVVVRETSGGSTGLLSLIPLALLCCYRLKRG